MDDRDWFAALSMGGMLASPTLNTTNATQLAISAYKVANQMMLVRDLSAPELVSVEQSIRRVRAAMKATPPEPEATS